MDNQNMVNQNAAPAPAAAPAPQEMSVGAWVGTLILACIPVVNFIMLIVWAVSSAPEKRARKNWAIAQLIIMAIGVVLYIISVIVFGVSLFNAFS